MFISDCLSVNENGHLTIGGADTVSLAERYGTPLYCLSEEEIVGACREFTGAIRQFYGPESLVAYASKALNCKELCRIMAREGLGLDVASGGELYTAMSVDFPAGKIFMHGNNKTSEELQYALECGVGYIVVDNHDELSALAALARAHGTRQNILLRIKPGVEAHTHEFIKTGSIDSKFGFALENGEAEAAVAEAMDCDSLIYKGLHCHIGSQIFEAEPFCEAARVMLGFIAHIKEQFNRETEILNLGGGFGIRYTPFNEPSAPAGIIAAVSKTIEAECRALGLERPFMVIEPGRALVAPAGITLYTVGNVKEIKNVRTYVAVDGGMTDNPRYALYKAPYSMILANKARQPAEQRVTVSGRCCENDPLQENIDLQQAEAGDILAVLATGAYNYAMASNYNRLRRPAMVAIKDGQPRIIVNRESYEDIIKNDL